MSYCMHAIFLHYFYACSWLNAEFSLGPDKTSGRWETSKRIFDQGSGAWSHLQVLLAFMLR